MVMAPFATLQATRALLAPKPHHSFTPIFEDFDHDGKLDLFIANDSDPNQLFLNQGNGRFKEAALERGIATNGNGSVQSNMGVAVQDLDARGRISLLTTTFMNDYFPLFRQDTSGFFDDISASAGLINLTHLWLGWACGFADFDNSGRRELWLANGHVYPRSPHYLQPISILREQANQFKLDYQYPAVPDNSYRGGATGDFDNDGKLDLVVLPISGPPVLLHNGDSRLEWLGFGLNLRGTKSNPHGFFSHVTVEFCGNSAFDTLRNGGGYLSRNDPRLHFGLAGCGKVDRLTLRWPSGIVQELRNLPAGSYVDDKEPF